MTEFSGRRRKFQKRQWLSRRGYQAYMLREATSFFILIYSVFYLIMLLQLSSGPQSYASFIQLNTNPAIIGLNLLLFAFAVYHSVTWLFLTGKIVRLKLRRGFVDPKIIALGGILIWLVASIIVSILVYI